jgi:uncharacterized protein (DUF1499 family)
MLRRRFREVPVHTSRLSQLAIAIAGTSAVLFVSMPLISKMGAMPSRVSFPLFMLGGLLGLVGLLLALVALYTTRPATGRAGRGLAWTASALGAAVLIGVAFAAGSAAGLPPINDITTDPGDPPQFSALTHDGPNAGRDMSYPGESFATPQRAAYPDLGPIAMAGPPADTFAAVNTAIESFGWRIVAADAGAGVIEATDTSRIFRFVDDVVVRIRADGGGSRVDVRSKSREGKGDLGANAKRIRRLRDALGVAPVSSLER